MIQASNEMRSTSRLRPTSRETKHFSFSLCRRVATDSPLYFEAVANFIHRGGCVERFSISQRKAVISRRIARSSSAIGRDKTASAGGLPSIHASKASRRMSFFPPRSLAMRTVRTVMRPSQIAVVMSFNDRPVYRAASGTVYHPGSIDVSFILGLYPETAGFARVGNPSPTG
jgi:hypothetical protein